MKILVADPDQGILSAYHRVLEEDLTRDLQQMGVMEILWKEDQDWLYPDVGDSKAADSLARQGAEIRRRILDEKAGSVPCERLKILLVDAETEILRLCRELLEGRCGHEVTTAQDGQEALDRVAAGDFDLMIIEPRLPKLDGLQAVSEMRRLGLQTPVVVMGGYCSDQITDRFEELNVPEVLRKPVKVTTLMDVVNRVGGAAK